MSESFFAQPARCLLYGPANKEAVAAGRADGNSGIFPTEVELAAGTGGCLATNIGDSFMVSLMNFIRRE